MDLADVHAWTSPKSARGHCTKLPASVVPPKRKLYLRKNQWLWWELNPSLLHGSPVPNRLDHGGQLKLYQVIVDYISNF